MGIVRISGDMTELRSYTAQEEGGSTVSNNSTHRRQDQSEQLSFSKIAEILEQLDKVYGDKFNNAARTAVMAVCEAHNLVYKDRKNAFEKDGVEKYLQDIRGAIIKNLSDRSGEKNRQLTRELLSDLPDLKNSQLVSANLEAEAFENAQLLKAFAIFDNATDGRVGVNPLLESYRSTVVATVSEISRAYALKLLRAGMSEDMLGELRKDAEFAVNQSLEKATDAAQIAVMFSMSVDDFENLFKGELERIHQDNKRDVKGYGLPAKRGAELLIEDIASQIRKGRDPRMNMGAEAEAQAKKVANWLETHLAFEEMLDELTWPDGKAWTSFLNPDQGDVEAETFDVEECRQSFVDYFDNLLECIASELGVSSDDPELLKAQIQISDLVDQYKVLDFFPTPGPQSVRDLVTQAHFEGVRIVNEFEDKLPSLLSSQSCLAPQAREHTDSEFIDF